MEYQISVQIIQDPHTADLKVYSKTANSALTYANQVCRKLASKIQGTIFPPQPQGFDEDKSLYAVGVNIFLNEDDTKADQILTRISTV